ncbi:hypothetical protein BCR33DRAFT_5145 [Rhizoclosmatium globosum]|uniref:Uncharacterized protein n=1 Tax=Rhizoclosmatium globosum TaxID=329046 RepID=A0A1Y2D310_9FUNG|nr:hypothetical protein BCR33DRAFT_5145 [Rhizoclosmatium globosum]|eukprot:ORY53640.1 hypothetical protein BCR33DRAFT_5145 [Rhizoclosmatium globosum]
MPNTIAKENRTPGTTVSIQDEDQVSIKQRLENFKRQKEAQRLREKQARAKEAAFVVTAPKKAVIDFVPSIIRSEPLVEVQVPPTTPANLSTTQKPNKKSWVPSTNLSKPSTFHTPAAKHTETHQPHSSLEETHEEWDLKTEMYKVFDEAKIRATTIHEKQFLSRAMVMFERMMNEVTKSPNAHHVPHHIQSTTSTPASESMRVTPGMTPKTPYIDQTIPTDTGSSTPMTPTFIRPPTPAFLEYRDPTDTVEDVDLDAAMETPVFENEENDDEVVFTGSTVAGKVLGDKEEVEASMEVTPPRSKYLDHVLMKCDEGEKEDMDAICGAFVVEKPGVEADVDHMEMNVENNHVEENVNVEESGFDEEGAVQPAKASKQGTPHPHKLHRTPDDLAMLMSRVSISEESGTPVKSERKIRDGREVRVGFSSVKGEVKIGPSGSTDGSVVVLTPRRANKREKEELGVDSVVTNARRSLRFMPVDLTNSPLSVAPAAESASVEVKKEYLTPRRMATHGPLAAYGPDAGERVKKLLEEHGNAFVPNKVFIVEKYTVSP